ncbi:hypothetical protein E2C01_049317 [Portunus trituberculatus]|uniref:Uncharacterized protein n=1 Tax=Portunus trituberculatus TaxID=210409 RepID=A0A5B7GDM1_PORTR|nr:hypothetical protein [Portunus trituberculatus]
MNMETRPGTEEINPFQYRDTFLLFFTMTFGYDKTILLALGRVSGVR